MLFMKSWMIPDCYYESQSHGQPSHEAVCVLNTGGTDATVTMTLYFEDREPMHGFVAHCAARRTHHIRMDKIVSQTGERVPMDVPYAVHLTSDADLSVQYSRLSTAQAEMALMTTIAHQA
jgi:hypothetical protein